MSRYSLLLVEWEDDATDETIAKLTRAVGERMKENVSGITQVFHELPESAYLPPPGTEAMTPGER